VARVDTFGGQKNSNVVLSNAQGCVAAVWASRLGRRAAVRQR